MRDLTNVKDHGTKRGSALRCHRDASVAYGPHMWTTLAVQRRYDAHTACREHECKKHFVGKDEAKPRGGTRLRNQRQTDWRNSGEAANRKSHGPSISGL